MLFDSVPTPQTEPTIPEMLEALSETAVLVVKAVMVMELQGQHEAAQAFMKALEAVK